MSPRSPTPFVPVRFDREAELPRVVDRMNVLERRLDQAGVQDSYRTVTANATMNVSEELILVDTAGGAVTITLPAASETRGQVFNVKFMNGGSNVVISSGDNIDKAATITLTIIYQCAGLYSDGTTYWRLY